MNKYEPLFIFLKENENKNEITLSFEQIEKILGKKLPQKAYIEIQRWANTDSHIQANAWIKAGWVVEHPGEVIKTGKVKFIKRTDKTMNNFQENDEKEKIISEDESKINNSIPIGRLIIMILIPIIPLGLAFYNSSKEKEEIAKIYFRIALIGIGIGIMISILAKAFK